MSWHISLTLLDEQNTVMATADTTHDRSDWKAPLKAELARTEAKHIAQAWKKMTVVVEKV